jgi:hypothetical protein
MISETKQTNDCPLPDLPDAWKAQESRLPEHARQDFDQLLARLRQDSNLSGVTDEELLGKYARIQFQLLRSMDTTTDLLPNSGAEWTNDEALTLLRRQTRFQLRYQRKAERLYRWMLQLQNPKSSHRKRTPLQSSWKTFRRCSRNLRAAQLTATGQYTSGHQKNFNSNQQDSKELSWKTMTSTL